MKGTSTLDSAMTHTGAPEMTRRCTASSRTGEPEVRTSTTSVSALGGTGSAAKRSTRTSAEVVWGTNASRTQATMRPGAVASTYTATRTGVSDSSVASIPSLKAFMNPLSGSCSQGIFISLPLT